MLYTRLAVCTAVPELAIHTADPNLNPNPNSNPNLVTCESEISVRIESRIESGGSRLHVQCRLSCESYVFNNV